MNVRSVWFSSSVNFVTPLVGTLPQLRRNLTNHQSRFVTPVQKQRFSNWNNDRRNLRTSSRPFHTSIKATSEGLPIDLRGQSRIHI